MFCKITEFFATEPDKSPYSKLHIAIQAKEADLMKECLESVKLSMKLGDVKSAMFLLEKRFSSEGYGKAITVNMTSENVNVNVNQDLKYQELEKMRASYLRSFQGLRIPLRNDKKWNFLPKTMHGFNSCSTLEKITELWGYQTVIRKTGRSLRVCLSPLERLPSKYLR